MPKKKSEEISFESALSELETIVQKLEQGELSLEESMNFFERGLTLSHLSQTTLQNAEQRIKILMQKNGEASLENFDVSEKTEP